MKQSFFLFCCMFVSMCIHASQQYVPSAPIPIPGACPEQGNTRRKVSSLIQIQTEYHGYFTQPANLLLEADIYSMPHKKLTKKEAVRLEYYIQRQMQQQKKLGPPDKWSGSGKKNTHKTHQRKSV